MHLLTFSGSSRPESSNIRLLKALSQRYQNFTWEHFTTLDLFPLFTPQQDKHPYPKEVVALKEAIAKSDAIIIATPEYLHNIPAQLKNVMEWLTTTGELAGKSVMPIVYTPKAPRGEKAMQSFQWTLKALDARIICALSLYQEELKIGQDHELIADMWVKEMIDEAFSLLNK